MKVGIVCEGPTDFFAIKEFFGAAMKGKGVDCKLFPIQPDIDNTRPEGGWTQVMSWLDKNPPRSRVLKYFGPGLFKTSIDTCDAILIQIDTDILDEPSFINYMNAHFSCSINVCKGAAARADEVRRVLWMAACLDELTEADQYKHVLAPAVESTENWCVAAFVLPTTDFETLSGQALVDAFMSSLLRYEGQTPTPPYSQIDKTVRRRERFCRDHAGFHGRVAKGCQQFQRAQDQLVELAGR